MGQIGKKQRMCPAVGHGISAAECGENRISRYQCPADCPHNPWALGAYDQEQEIETAFFERLRRYAAGDPVTRGVRNAAESTMIADQYRNLRAWFIQRDEQGQTMMDRWARAGFQGLNNDQRVLARCHAQVRVVVMETLDHVSRDAVRARDRLDHQLKALIRASQSQPEGSDAWYKTTMPAPKEKMALQLCALLLSETELSLKPPPKPITFEAFLLGVHILRAVTQELDRE